MAGIVSLDDVSASGNGDGSTEADDNDSDEFAGALTEVDADVEHARECVEQNDGTDEDDLIEYAESLDEEMLAQAEEYRRNHDVHRIKQNFLWDIDADFTEWKQAFYGDSEDPEEGTYNYVQQESRDMDVNLFYHKALFPEPLTEHWESDAVVWMEYDIGYTDGEQDAHIYVTKEFVDEYGQFSREVEGKQRPLPPSDDQVGGSGGSSTSDTLVVDPTEFTVDELRDELQEELEGGASEQEFRAVESAEESGDDRKTALKAIRGAANQAADAGNEGSQTSIEDFDSGKVQLLVEAGLDRDEIVETLS